MRAELWSRCYYTFFVLFSCFPICSDFLGRLQPSKTTIQKTLGTPGVGKSSSPRKVVHFYTSNSSRGRMRAELWRFEVGRLSTSKGCPRDLVSRLDFRRFSSPILVLKEPLKTFPRSLYRVSRVRDLVRESSGNFLEEFEDPSDLLE